VSVSHDSGKLDLPTALFSYSLNVVVLLSPPLTKYFQWCLHNVVHVLVCIILLRQCLTLQGLQGSTPVPIFPCPFFPCPFFCPTRAHFFAPPVPTFGPCGFVPTCAYMCLDLCLFLVRWSVICCQDGCFMVRQRCIARRVS